MLGRRKVTLELKAARGHQALVGTVGTADQFLHPGLWTLRSKKFAQEAGPAIKASMGVLLAVVGLEWKQSPKAQMTINLFLHGLYVCKSSKKEVSRTTYSKSSLLLVLMTPSHTHLLLELQKQSKGP